MSESAIESGEYSGVRDILFPGDGESAVKPPRVDQPEDPGTDQPEPPAAAPAPEPVTGTLLQDALGEDVDYWTLEIPLGDDGKTATIEQAKDALTQVRRTERQANELAERESQFKAQALKDRQELAQVVQALQMPGGLNEENVRRVQDFSRQWQQGQEALIRSVAPEALSRDNQRAFSDLASRYGATPDEVELVLQALPAWARLIFDDWRADKSRIEEIKREQPKRKAQAPQAGKPARTSPKQRLASGEISQTQAVRELLFGSR